MRAYYEVARKIYGIAQENSWRISTQTLIQTEIGIETYSIKMNLTKNIPQLIPMFGKQIRIYYCGVSKLCSNCYDGHLPLHYRNEKVLWINYMLRFMEENPNIPEEM